MIPFATGILYQGKFINDLGPKRTVGSNPPKGQVAYKEYGMCISTQPYEERMQRHRIIETSD